MLTIVWKIGGVRTFSDPDVPEYHNHDDMLRYDVAFCSPKNPEMVVFPIFKKGKEGKTTQLITVDRWRSFGLTLDRASFNPKNVFDWITFRNEKFITLKEFMMEHGYTLVGWR